MGGQGQGRQRGPICPRGAARPGEVVIWNAPPCPPCPPSAGRVRVRSSRNREGASWVESETAGVKSKAGAPQAAVQGTRRRAAGCEAGGVGCSVRKVLGGAQRRGRGPCAAQVATAARGRTPGWGDGAPSGLPDAETGGFCSPTPAGAGFVPSHLTLSDLGETTSSSSEAASLRLAGWRRSSQLSPFEVLRVSQHAF